MLTSTSFRKSKAGLSKKMSGHGVNTWGQMSNACIHYLSVWTSVLATLPTAGELELDGLQGLFHPEPWQTALIWARRESNAVFDTEDQECFLRIFIMKCIKVGYLVKNTLCADLSCCWSTWLVKETQWKPGYFCCELTIFEFSSVMSLISGQHDLCTSNLSP